MLALGRNVLASDRRIRADGLHGWRPTFYGRLAGATVGIIGYGAVGQAIARPLRLFWHAAQPGRQGGPDAGDFREEPGAGKPHARICEGEAEWPSYSTTIASSRFDNVMCR